MEHLESLSIAPLAFEKEQNPIDYEAKRKKCVMPIFKQFKKATEKNIEEFPHFIGDSMTLGNAMSA
ncbi:MULTISPECIES: hypothetical protein [Helicobacter]|uniref:hypothetical protein n=1 Tax=Helicobacter TaxID=209 RepID=UPI00262580F7|nr:hypothetical protein [Helicobacter sp. UBA3407]